jgi:Uma2 family endonuclease
VPLAEGRSGSVIAHAELIRPEDEVDLSIDPPPDLVIEVELTSSAIKKLKLFAAMGVPEVWRHDGTKLWMGRLVAGEYQQIESSLDLPGLSAATIDGFLVRRFDLGETTLIREFRAAITVE